MNNSQDNTQTHESKQGQVNSSSIQSDTPSSTPSSINPKPTRSNSKFKILILVVILILVLGLGSTAYFLTRRETPYTSIDTPSTSKQVNDKKSLPEIISIISVDIPKINANLQQEEIDTTIRNTRVIEYRNKADYVSGIAADPSNSIYFKNTKYDGIVQNDQGQAENYLIVNILKDNGFTESKKNLGVDYDSPDIPLNTIFTNDEFVCQVNLLQSGFLDIGLGCITKSKLAEELVMIDEYYTAIQKTKAGYGGHKDLIYQTPTRKDSQTTGYKIGKIFNQVPQGSGGTYYLYYGKDKVWKVATSSQQDLVCDDFADNLDAILAYKGEECLAIDGTTKSVF
ncbi:hypothetical protein KDA08_05525 [Candidatus Saccharibacteria bacterium]|nr:hypothetical protein [Candidatus Saccharibacteria bacterium]